MSSPKPYIPPSTPSQQNLSLPPPISVPLGARLAPPNASCSGSLLLGSMGLDVPSQPQQHYMGSRLVYSKNVNSNPRHEAIGNKQVSSLYVPCLSNNICWAKSENYSPVARDSAQDTPLEAAGTQAPAPSHVPGTVTASTGKPPPAPPPDPPKLSFNNHKDAGNRGENPTLGTWASFPDAVRPPRLGPQVTSDPENQKNKETYLLQPCYPAKDATSSSPAPSEVIVVPLYLVNTDRGQGQEGTARTPASLGPLGCVHTVPATTPAASPLTFPTLDDFIPPHLQRRPHHSQPASACGSLSPASQTPSPSPPPPLVPPIPEDLHRGLEPDLPGAVSSTVSLLDPLPRGYPECLLLTVKPSLSHGSTKF